MYMYVLEGRTFMRSRDGYFGDYLPSYAAMKEMKK